MYIPEETASRQTRPLTRSSAASRGEHAREETGLRLRGGARAPRSRRRGVRGRPCLWARLRWLRKGRYAFHAGAGAGAPPHPCLDTAAVGFHPRHGEPCRRRSSRSRAETRPEAEGRGVDSCGRALALTEMAPRRAGICARAVSSRPCHDNSLVAFRMARPVGGLSFPPARPHREILSLFR